MSSVAYLNIDPGTTGALVKGARTTLHGIYLFNNAATVRFVKLYDKATAGASTDTPAMVFPVPATSGATLSFGPVGLRFSAGLSIRVTTGIAHNDTGAPTANDVVVNLAYQ